jgi:hypothetical protein
MIIFISSSVNGFPPLNIRSILAFICLSDADVTPDCFGMLALAAASVEV